MQSDSTVLVLEGKTPGTAIMLTLLFGPIGMFYSTIAGGIIMSIVSFVVAFLTFGLGLFFTWPICIIWAAMAARSHNNKRALSHLTPQRRQMANVAG